MSKKIVFISILVLSLLGSCQKQDFVEDRRTAPLFLQRGEQGWMLDFASLHRFVGFNHRNQWHL